MGPAYSLRKSLQRNCKLLQIASADPVFIVGMPRSGTTWLVANLNRHPEIVSFGETAFWGRAYIPPTVTPPSTDCFYNHEQLQVLRNRLIDPYLFEDCVREKKADQEQFSTAITKFFKTANASMTPGQLFMEVSSVIGRVVNCGIVVEKTPHHVNHVNRILSHLPSAKFLVMRRPAYSFLLSYKHQADRKTGMAKKTFASLYHPIVPSLVWKKCSDSIERITSADSAVKTLVIEFSSIAERPSEIIQEACHFAGATQPHPIESSGKVNSSFPDKKPKALGAADIFWMNVMNKRLLKKQGEYQCSINKPSDVLEIVVSFFTVLPWIVRNTLSLSRRSGNGLAYFLGYLPSIRQKV